MATNVRLKDAAGEILHPETDWSVVQNKPSISVDQTSHTNENWDFSGYINISSGYGLKLSSSGSKIQVSDQSTNGMKTLDNYPINWSAIAGKPSITASTTAGESWIVNSTAVNKLRSLTIKTNYGTNDAASGSGSIAISGGNGLSLENRFGKIKVSDSATNYKSTDLSNYPISWEAIPDKTKSSTPYFGYASYTDGTGKTYSGFAFMTNIYDGKNKKYFYATTSGAGAIIWQSFTPSDSGYQFYPFEFLY